VGGGANGGNNLESERGGNKKGNKFDPHLIENVIRYALTLQTDHPLDLSLQTKSGHHMLHLAVIMGFQNIVEILIIDLHDNNGWTALHFAAFFGREEMVKKLLEHGDSPFADNDKGNFPVDLAQNSVIKSLLMEKQNSEAQSCTNDDHVILIEETPEFDTSLQGKKLDQLPRLLWALFCGALVKFWWNYRVFLYIGLLAASGVWTLLDYVPTILGTAPSPPVVVYPKGVRPLQSVCNPPTIACGNPDQLPSGKPIVVPVDPTVVERSFKLAPLPSLESYLLNFGQFATFIIALLLIVYHFKKQLGPLRFWSIVGLIFVAFLVGCLFVFNVV